MCPGPAGGGGQHPPSHSFIGLCSSCRGGSRSSQEGGRLWGRDQVAGIFKHKHLRGKTGEMCRGPAVAVLATDLFVLKAAQVPQRAGHGVPSRWCPRPMLRAPVRTPCSWPSLCISASPVSRCGETQAGIHVAPQRAGEAAHPASPFLARELLCSCGGSCWCWAGLSWVMR